MTALPVPVHPAVTGAVQGFPLSAVRLGDGPLRHAQLTDVEHVLRLDPDRLLAPFLREAGLASPAPGYGSWEAIGLDGHLGGHYLSALAQLHAATDDPRLLPRLERMLDVLERCQEAAGDGWLGGVPDGREFGRTIAEGRIEADTFDLEGRWVPLYNLHKTLGGLLDAHEHTGSARALRLAEGMADWWLGVSAHLDDDAFEGMLATEHGGMCDAFATLAGITGRADLLAEARRFAQRALVDPLAAGRDELDGLHANTQIPKVIGIERLGRMTGDERLLAASDAFWDSVVHRRSVVIGGNSVREHFHPSRDFAPMVLDEQGPETCNSYNMLELARLRFERTGDPAILDQVERTTLGHVLSTQHPEHGGLVYFTSLRPAHHRVYSVAGESMWCCVGTGMENHARYGEQVFAHAGDDALLVDLYVPAELDWAARGIRARIEGDVVRTGTATVTIEAAAEADLVLRLRRPGWATSMEVRVGGEPVAVGPGAADVPIRRTWSGTTVVTVHLGMEVRAEGLPDGSAWTSFRYGPVPLASRDGRDGIAGSLAEGSRMGHVTPAPKVPLERTPVITATDPASAVALVDRSALAFRLDAWRGGERVAVALEPFAGIHDERYTLVWPTGADPVARAAELRAMDAAGTDGDVVDEVVAGEQQPEVDHAFRGEGTRAGGADGVHWRSATGWFSYELRDPTGMATAVRVRLRRDAREAAGGAAAGAALAAAPVGQSIRVGGVEAVADPREVGGEADDDALDVRITEAMRAGSPDGTITVRVDAAPGGRTRDVLGIQLRR
ncbi:glycoside hydrolase family 127 protein [Clavibacter michiganensis subsp. phaseoli]|uniref:Glycoside hydrolase family 127 protein n=1 Tax=Clavibacter phaseoli TaxID=1734031 RepID=A0A8I0S7M1_9MICO|nr:beta-L-arabinofuranosidase domain-containing protein [Clavibacter phaseoli]MBF4630982.1 glycoside hydrolase family 127 protein [Clavibacter phaseoli]